MKTLEICSERYSPNGNLAGSGYRRLLGRPSMDLLQTVIREGLQNVVDAADQGNPPRATIRVRTLSASQREALRANALAVLPHGGESAALIQSTLGREGIRVFELCDFGTAGLSGPTDADAPPAEGEKLNFVNFLKNVGATRDTPHGGGTYGYGKSSFYALSECSTIIVDSQTTSGGSPVRRLMACHLGDAFDALSPDESRELRFTGRHWWGVRHEDGRVDPLTDVSASSLALELGLPPRSANDTGTSIMVIDPSIDGSDVASMANRIVTCALINFWPRMCASTPYEKRLQLEIHVDGNLVELPRPEDFPPLDLYSSALASLRSGVDGTPITRYSTDLGRLSFNRGPRSDRHPMTDADGSDVLARSSHIALMRPVELIVRYLPGQPFADDRYEWAGVFVTSDDDQIEAAFADSEPPTHDDWVPENLHSGESKAVVRLAMQKLKKAAADFAPRPNHVTDSKSSSPSLAATAGKMGRFLAQVSATSPGLPNRRSSKPGAASRVRIGPPEFVGLSIGGDGGKVATFKAELYNDGSIPELQINANARLVADGAKASDRDVPLAFLPRTIDISLPQHSIEAAGPALTVGKLGGTLFIRTSVPTGAAVEVELETNVEGAR